MSSARTLRTKPAGGGARRGPKTSEGKRRAARNAWRHGLAVPVLAEPEADEAVAELARVIAAPIVGGKMSGEVFEHACRIAEAQIDLVRIKRVRHALLVRALAQPAAVGSWQHLARLERYERRTRSRRKFAIRDFDDAVRSRAARLSVRL